MKIISDLSSTPSNCLHTVLLIGNFDAIHRGHRYIIDTAKAIAKKSNQKLALLTFDPHPALVLNPTVKNINLFFKQDKIQLLKEAGIEVLFLQKFDKEFSDLTASEFIEDVLYKKLHISALVVGENFRFGAKRQGTTEYIQQVAQLYNFHFYPVKLFNYMSTVISSSKIRESLAEGNIAEASSALGYDYLIKNEIIRGKQNGRKIGFPTANLKIDGLSLPKRGVYAARAFIEGDSREFDAIANLGLRPTIDEQELLEVHLFDFNEEIYGKILKVYLKNYIRPQIKFNGLEELKKQISIDVQKAKNFLEK